MLLIDVDFTDPFAPYSLAYAKNAFEPALRKLGEILDVSDDTIDRLRESRNSATKSHRVINWKKIGLWGAGGFAVIVAAGVLAAPAIAGIVGGSAGFSGAAATSYGLAVFGGGSLAVGGYGMAGGMVLLPGLAGSIGSVGTSGFEAIKQFNSAVVDLELIKLAVTYRTVMLVHPRRRPQADKSLSILEEYVQCLDKQIDNENNLNDKGCSRIRDLENKKRLIQATVDWMKRERDTIASCKVAQTKTHWGIAF
ncbi:MAG TPA: hypothetical protein VFW40_00150, partial [Capsulimonadaceae bacterium]|nr:hypothetical protein [Capsulimonadaceae bacterium]